MDCFVASLLAMTVVGKKRRARPWGTGGAARALKRGGWGGLLFQPTSTQRHLTSIELTSSKHEQDLAEREQDHTRNHLQFGVSRRPRQRDRAGRLRDDGLRPFQRRDLNLRLLVIRAAFRRRCRKAWALAEHLFKIPTRRQVDRQFRDLERVALRTGRYR